MVSSRTAGTMLAAAGICFALSSCKVDHQNVVKAIRIGVQAAIELGFTQWKKKDPQAVKETSKALNKSINEDILPWIKGQATLELDRREEELKSSTEVQIFLNSSIMKNLPEEARLAILAASVILDMYLPVPDVNKKLTQEQVDYIVAFLSGIEAATLNFMDTTRSFERKSTWIK